MTTPEELLAWLTITDIEDIPPEDLRAFLVAVLEAASDEEGPWEEMLSDMMDLLDMDVLDLEAMKELPNQYGHLAPDIAEADELVVELKVQAGRIRGDQCAGTRLQIFLGCLLGLSEPEGSEQRSRSEENLRLVEDDLCEGWNGYAGNPLTDFSARSLATHRVLAEAFEAWGNAIDLARSGQNDAALEEAMRGSRLFAALETWTQPEAA